MTLAFGFTLLLSSLSAQVKLNLSQLSDQETYLVSLVSETSLQAPEHTTGLVQIVLQVPAEAKFALSELKSLVPNETWQTFTVKTPKGASKSNFLCFTLANKYTTNIDYRAGLETPLFTFKNAAANGCVDGLRLIDNDDSVVKAVSREFNITQNLTVLGARGNAFRGLRNASLDCGKNPSLAGTANKELELVQVFPVPSSDVVDVRWKWAEASWKNMHLVVTDISGKEVYRLAMQDNWQANQVQINVSDWAVGLYTLRFVAEDFVSAPHKLIVSR